MGWKVGARLRSAVCDTEVVIVKTSDAELDLRCGGHPMVAIGDEPPPGLAVEPGFDTASLIGKRYTDPAGQVELLCTKGGTSALSLGCELLELKEAKPLPSSD